MGVLVEIDCAFAVRGGRVRHELKTAARRRRS